MATRTDELGLTTYGYDDLDRLTSAAYPGGASYAYGYDEVGNMTTSSTPSGQVTHAYDAANQISDSGYVYDGNGSLVSDGTRSLAYDALNRLTSVTAPAGSETYALDGDGNRWSVTSAGNTVAFDLDLRGLPGILAAGGRLYLPGAAAAGYDEGGSWTTSLSDVQGSILRNVASDGTLGTRIVYDPYGSVVSGSTGGAIGYTGEWTDPSGLVDLRARSYDPSLGRFMSADTWPGDPASPLTGNRYAYGLDNPVNYTDPTGHIPRAMASRGLPSYMIYWPGVAESLAPLVIANLFSRAYLGKEIFSPDADVTPAEQQAADQAIQDSIALATIIGMMKSARTKQAAAEKELSTVKYGEGAALEGAVERDATLVLPKSTARVVEKELAADAAALERTTWKGSLEGAEQVYGRVAALQDMRAFRGGTTAGIRVADPITGDVRTLLATESPSMPSAWRGQLAADESYVGGMGHAEQTILDGLRPGGAWQGYVPIEGATSRGICWRICTPALRQPVGGGLHPATIGGPVFGHASQNSPYRMFWWER